MREKEYLRQRYASMFSSIGIILLASGMIMLTPLIILLSHRGEAAHAPSFIIPAGCMIFIGFFLWKLFRPASSITLSIQEGGIIVVLSWIVVILFSAWPFARILGLSFSRALFESVSGWTTTGLSVVDISSAGPLVLIWRSTIQLAGGAGLAIIMMSAIVGPASAGISRAEGRSDQLVPNVKRSARLVLVIYACYAAGGTLAYWISGMSPFDAVNHSFAAVSTGGFSTHQESIGFWDSAAIEAVTLPLMILGNMSFVTAWFLWRGKIRVVARNGEIRLLAVLILLFSTVMFLFTSQAIYPQLGKSVRAAVFETVTAITTTGYTTVSYSNWPPVGTLLIILLMIIGGGACSTAGGIKQFRVFILMKSFIWEIRRHFMPRTAKLERPVWEGNRLIYVDDARIRKTAVFVFIYLGTYVLGAILLCACGYGLSESLFEFASAIGTVGLSVGVTSARMPDTALWAEILAMFLGRLEFIVVIVSILKIGSDARLMLGK